MGRHHGDFWWLRAKKENWLCAEGPRLLMADDDDVMR